MVCKTPVLYKLYAVIFNINLAKSPSPVQLICGPVGTCSEAVNAPLNTAVGSSSMLKRKRSSDDIVQQMRGGGKEDDSNTSSDSDSNSNSDSKKRKYNKESS